MMMERRKQEKNEEKITALLNNYIFPSRRKYMMPPPNTAAPTTVPPTITATGVVDEVSLTSCAAEDSICGAMFVSVSVVMSMFVENVDVVSAEAGDGTVSEPG